jgi:hypothetical protein
MSDDNQSNPSMEQILQTIRSVVSGEMSKDDNQKADEILELTEVVKPGNAGSKVDSTVDDTIDLLSNIDNIITQEQKAASSTPEEEPREFVPLQTAISEPQEVQQPTDLKLKAAALISQKAASDSTEALKLLVKKASKPLADGPAFRSGITIEELVVEMIKPHLSEWLDQNLPNIVKHVVEKEVQKLVPKEDD